MTLTKIIHNLETGEIVEVELTAEELAEAEAATKAAEKVKAEEAAKMAAKAALLEKLGITEEEAKLLLS